MFARMRSNQNSHVVVGRINDISTLGERSAFSFKKWNIHLLSDPALPFLRIHSREITHISSKDVNNNDQNSFIHNSPNGENPSCPPTEWINQPVILYSRLPAPLPNTSNTDESQDCCEDVVDRMAPPKGLRPRTVGLHGEEAFRVPISSPSIGKLSWITPVGHRRRHFP